MKYFNQQLLVSVFVVVIILG